MKGSYASMMAVTVELVRLVEFFLALSHQITGLKKIQ